MAADADRASTAALDARRRRASAAALDARRRRASAAALDARRRRASVAALVAGVVAGMAFTVLADGGIAQAGVVVAMAALAAVAAVARLVRERLRGPWSFLAAGAVVYAVATLFWAGAPAVTGEDLPFPSYVDLLYFTSYALYAAFLARLTRGSGDERKNERRLALLDVAVFTIAATPVIWEAILRNQALGSGSRLAEQVVAVGYPAFILVLFALAVRLVITDLSYGVVGRLLLAWIGLELVADSLYAYESAHGRFAFGADSRCSGSGRTRAWPRWPCTPASSGSPTQRRGRPAGAAWARCWLPRSSRWR